MPSSFFNKSPFKVLTPFIYSMGLVNMVETGLMKLICTNIFQVKENICHRGTEIQFNIEYGRFNIVELFLVRKNIKYAIYNIKFLQIYLFVLSWKRLGLLNFLFPGCDFELAALNSGVSPNSSGIFALGTGLPSNFSMAKNFRCSLTLTKV